MFAGDNFKPAADASYRNFDAGPSFHIGSNVRKNNEIGTIDSWGPFFRVSLDLMIHSYNPENGWSSLLTFKGNGGTTNNIRNGDRIPGIFLNERDKYLTFSNAVEPKKNYQPHKINLSTWYNILIEQKIVNRNKVR